MPENFMRGYSSDLSSELPIIEAAVAAAREELVDHNSGEENDGLSALRAVHKDGTVSWEISFSAYDMGRTVLSNRAVKIETLTNREVAQSVSSVWNSNDDLVECDGRYLVRDELI